MSSSRRFRPGCVGKRLSNLSLSQCRPSGSCRLKIAMMTRGIGDFAETAENGQRVAQDVPTRARNLRSVIVRERIQPGGLAQNVQRVQRIIGGQNVILHAVGCQVKGTTSELVLP